MVSEGREVNDAGFQLRLQQAIQLHRQGNFTEAKRLYRQILQDQPRHYGALHLLGVIALQTHDIAAAVALLEESISINPNIATVHNNLGNGRRLSGDVHGALASYDKAIALMPDYAEAHYNRGTALQTLKRPDEAAASYGAAIALKPDYAEAYSNLGVVLQDLQRHEEAVASCDKAIALKPDHAESYYNRGTALQNLRRHEAAAASYDKAIELKPDYDNAYWNKSFVLLRSGKLEQGWSLYEWRKRIASPVGHRHYAQPLWLGKEYLAGRTLFIHWEQGFGDTLQFCRYAALVKARGAHVVMSVQDPLVQLLTTMDPDIRVIGGDQTPPEFDYHCPLMSLPLALGTTLETIPSAVPYVHAAPEKSASWRSRLAALPGLKVGLVWAGSPRPHNPLAHEVDKRRSITLNHYAPLAAVPGLCLVSLQKGEPSAQARTPPDGMALHDWTEELDDFSDTAALVDALDLVVSVDTSIVHLAGALGKPVWILNRHDQCWRWLTDRSDSPWYPTARLFQQRDAGLWDDVIAQVTWELRGLVAVAHPRI